MKGFQNFAVLIEILNLFVTSSDLVYCKICFNGLCRQCFFLFVSFGVNAVHSSD